MAQAKSGAASVDRRNANKSINNANGSGNHQNGTGSSYHPMLNTSNMTLLNQQQLKRLGVNGGSSDMSLGIHGESLKPRNAGQRLSAIHALQAPQGSNPTFGMDGQFCLSGIGMDTSGNAGGF